MGLTGFPGRSGRAAGRGDPAGDPSFAARTGAGSRRLSLLCLLLLLAGGCSPPSSEPLRLGINPWPGYEFLYLAQEMGYFREEGLKLRLIEFASLSDARRAYERGQINALGTTLVDLLQIRAHTGRSPQVVRVLDYSNGADVILARPGVTNVAGLRAGRIGVEPSSLGGFVLARALEKAGMSGQDVVTVAKDPISLSDLFLEGDLDAVVTYPPMATQLVRDGRAREVFSSAEIPGEVVDVIAVEEHWVSHHPAEIQKLLRALERALEHARNDPGKAVPIMAARERITPAEFSGLLEHDIALVPASGQGVYLCPGGRLEQVLDSVDRALRAGGMLRGQDRRAGSITDAFFRAEGPAR